MRALVIFAAAVALLAVRGADARPLRDVIPGLFGGCVTLGTAQRCEPLQPTGLEQLSALSSLLRGGFAPPPLPSPSGAFRFAWDPRYDTYVRQSEGLAPLFAERATTLGAGQVIVDVSYTHASFDSFEGRSLDALEFTESAFSAAFLDSLPGRIDTEPFADDVLLTTADVRLVSDTVFVGGAYGLTDRIDVGAGFTVSRVRFKGDVRSEIRERSDLGRRGDAVFVLDPPATERFCEVGGAKDQRCVTSSFDETRSGFGDVYLRGKWQFARPAIADLAASATVTIPTDGADDFLGFDEPTWTPRLIASRRFDALSLHANLGYSVRTGDDVGQLQWILGSEMRALEWMTLGADFLGGHEEDRDGISDDVVQVALGFKVNPFGQAVVAANVQLPLNRDGLRADAIYTVQVEQTF